MSNACILVYFCSMRTTIILLISLLLPCFQAHASEFPYSFSSEAGWSTVGMATAGASMYVFAAPRMYTLEELEQLHRDSLFDPLGLDVSATRNFSLGAGALSDLTLSAQLLTPLAYNSFLLPNRLDVSGKQVAQLQGIYLQTISVGFLVNSAVKSLIGRPRPYLYNDSLSLEQKMAMGSDAFRSFYSGHTSTAFSSAAYFVSVYGKMHPDDNILPVAIPAFAVASLTGYLRYEAGAHFFTDILVGALIGTATGYIVPRLHEL